MTSFASTFDIENKVNRCHRRCVIGKVTWRGIDYQYDPSFREFIMQEDACGSSDLLACFTHDLTRKISLANYASFLFGECESVTR